MLDVNIELVLAATTVVVEIATVVGVIEPAGAIAMQRLDDHQSVALRLGPGTGHGSVGQRGDQATHRKQRHDRPLEGTPLGLAARWRPPNRAGQ